MNLAFPMLRVAQDTVAYVPRAGGPVDTSSYMWVGYAITWLVLVSYLVLLLRRIARARVLPAATEIGNRQ